MNILLPIIRSTNCVCTGRTIEEGANWIHGIEKNNNPLMELARAAKLKVFNTADTDGYTARNSNGQYAQCYF